MYLYLTVLTKVSARYRGNVFIFQYIFLLDNTDRKGKAKTYQMELFQI
jgi:hypothetical protein